MKVLGSPRTSYLPFYSKDGLSYDENGATILGRKFYWHNPKAETKQKEEKDNSDEKPKKSEKPYIDKGKPYGLNATMELIDTGSHFKFDVFFDRITKTEFDELVWVLTLGENKKDSNQLYKIGHGKPLGLGSAKIVIDDAKSRILGNDYEVKDITLNIKSNEVPNRFSIEMKNQIMCATQYDFIDGMISYPYVELGEDNSQSSQKKPEVDRNTLASHQWFTSNKGRTKEDPSPMMLKKVENGIDQKLYIYEAYPAE